MQAPDDLKVRGTQFWDEVTEAYDLDASALVMLAEVCRILDRLDRISAALNGHGRDWLKIADEVEDMVTRDGHRKVSIKIAVDGLLSEARQQQMALKQLLAQMKLGEAKKKSGEQEKSALMKWLEANA